MKLYTNRRDQVIEENIKPNLKMIYDLKIRGLNDKNIAKALGITVREFLNAKEEFELLRDTYDDAMMILSAQLTDIVVNRALGTDGRVDKDGNELPPDEKLAFKLLEKFDKRFSNKTETNVTVSIESVIREISRERRGELSNFNNMNNNEVEHVSVDDDNDDDDEEII